MRTAQKQQAQQLIDLIQQGDVKEALKLLKAVETWGQKALRDALYTAVKDETVFTRPEDQLTLTTALLDAGAGVNALYGRHGTTPLHIAARRGNLALVSLLLARGENVNASEDGMTPLQAMLAEGHSDLRVARALLEAGANPSKGWHRDGRIDFPDTQLQLAIKAGDIAMMELLLEYGADPGQYGGQDGTALHLATKIAAREGDLTFLALLLEHGADPNADGGYLGTPVTVAACADNVSLIDYLVQAGADVKQGHPLVSAAESYANTLKAMARLLALGADPDECDRSGYTPLIQAIIHHDTAKAKLLIDHGACLDKPAQTPRGEMTPLAYAREDPKYNADIIDYMLAVIAAHDTERARQEAGRYYAAGLVKVARDPRVGKPIAHWLEQGADPNSCNEYGRTALHYVAERGRPSNDAHMLLEAGADPNARDQFGYTPLHDAVLGNNPDILHALLDAGADPAALVARGIHAGYTALEIARIERKKHAIRLLDSISPAPRPLTPYEPELRQNESVKGFSHVYYEEDVAKNARGDYIYMRETGKKRRWAERGGRKKYTEPCVCVHKHRYMSEYRGTGIPRAEHPLRWRIAMEGCLHCGSGDVLVIYAGWGVQLNDGDLVWSYEVKCNACGYYSSWGYDEG